MKMIVDRISATIPGRALWHLAENYFKKSLYVFIKKRLYNAYHVADIWSYGGFAWTGH